MNMYLHCKTSDVYTLCILYKISISLVNLILHITLNLQTKNLFKSTFIKYRIANKMLNTKGDEG